MAKNRGPSKHSRAARRATSPSINTDKSLKNLPPLTRTIPRPSVLAAQHASGVTKKKSKRGNQVSAKARRRQEKGMEMAEAVTERTSKKLQRSFGRARAVQARSKNWEDVNKAALEDVDVAQRQVKGGDDDDEGEDGDGGWETDEDMGGDVAGKKASSGLAGAEAVVQPVSTSPPVDDDDDVIL